MRSRDRGSVTYYLCLVLLVLLGVIFAGISACRQAAARAVISCAAEEGLYSVFAQYDRELFERYGLLFVDAGYGTGSLHMAKILEETEEYSGYILDPYRGREAAGLLSGGAGLLGLVPDPSGSAVTGYVLATDQDGAAFRRQVCEQMKEQIGPDALKALKNRLSSGSEEITGQKNRRQAIREDKAELYHAEDEVRRPSGDAEEETEEGEDPPAERIRNPITIISRLKEEGILALAVPDAGRIPAGEISPGETVRSGDLNTGMNMAPADWDGNEASLYLTEFLCRYFPCYTDASEEETPVCQAEYAVGGFASDRENLEAVLDRILVIREASNMLYLMTDPARRAEADAMAVRLAAAVLQPELEPAISFGLKAAWAFGESVVDCRTLLSGGKIPLAKTQQSWQLDLDSLADLTEVADSRRKSSENGLAYTDYLRLLLMTKGESDLTESAMDLVQRNMRKGRASFRLDCCLDALAAELRVKAGTAEYTVCRSYGYDMK